MLIQLIYISKETHQFTEEELVELLKKARQNNSALGITGMLLYKSGKFLQILEGKQEVVEQLYDGIKKDSRHDSVITLSTTPLKQREFGDWSMAFRDLGNLDLKSIEGYNQAFILTKIFPDKLDFERFSGNVQAAHTLLNLFKTSSQLLDY